MSEDLLLLMCAGQGLPTQVSTWLLICTFFNWSEHLQFLMCVMKIRPSFLCLLHFCPSYCSSLLLSDEKQNPNLMQSHYRLLIHSLMPFITPLITHPAHQYTLHEREAIHTHINTHRNLLELRTKNRPVGARPHKAILVPSL